MEKRNKRMRGRQRRMERKRRRDLGEKTGTGRARENRELGKRKVQKVWKGGDKAWEKRIRGNGAREGGGGAQGKEEEME